MRSALFLFAGSLLAPACGAVHAQQPTSPPSPPSRAPMTITFLANEGVMLTAGGTSVLIDALFGEGLRGYGVVSAGTRALLERAAPPFDRVGAVLATHVHRDHFDATPVWRHLRSNPRAVLVSTPEAADSVRAAAGTTPPPGGRVVGVLPARGERRDVGDVAGARIHVLGLPHGSGPRRTPPQNLGFVVDVGGFRVLHIGDTGEPRATFDALRLDQLGIDVALLPMWYLTEPGLADVVRHVIRPSTIVALHVPPGTWRDRLFPSEDGKTRRQRDVEAAFPGVKFFSRELETFVVR